MKLGVITFSVPILNKLTKPSKLRRMLPLWWAAVLSLAASIEDSIESLFDPFQFINDLVQLGSFLSG